MVEEWETETLLIKDIQERVGKVSGKAFWAVSTDKGEYTCHEPNVFDELAKNQGNICKVKTLRTEKYNNLKGFVEVVEKKVTEPAGVVKSNASRSSANIEMLVSYAKDLCIADDKLSMDMAIVAVIAAYKKASSEL